MKGDTSMPVTLKQVLNNKCPTFKQLNLKTCFNGFDILNFNNSIKRLI